MGMSWQRASCAVALVTSVLMQLFPTAPARAQVQLPCDFEDPFGGAPPNYSNVSATPRYGIRPPEVVSLSSRVDGVAIQVGVLRPNVEAGRRVPVIVQASPYFHPLHTVDLRKCAPFLADNFVPQGYAVALVAVRATGDSGGCFDLMGPNERADVDQAVRWLGTRPWSNGSVGMTGVSYDGSTPWQVAAAGNPYLKTIVPVEGVPDSFDLLFGGGTPDWRGPGILSGAYIAENLDYALGRTPERNVETNACPDYAIAEAAGVYSSLTGELDPFGYWEARRYTDEVLRRYRGSVFLVQGLQDWNVNPGAQFPLITDLRARGRPVKMMLGQWAHTQPDLPSPPARRHDYADTLLRWFDRYLKGIRSSPVGAAVDVQSSDGRWRHESRWPPEGRRVLLRPSATGELATDESFPGTRHLGPDPAHFQDPLTAQAVTGFGVPGLHAEPGEICQQPSCVSFQTDLMTQDYRIAGLPRLRLHVTPLGTGGTISAYLYAAASDRLRRIGWGQVDLRFPRGGGSSTSVTPGQQLLLDFTIQPLDALVRYGERLVLVLSMGNTYNRLPASGFAAAELVLGDPADGLYITEVTPRAAQFFVPPS